MGFVRWCWASLNGATIVASETCALDLVRAEYVREIEPGEMVVINDDGVRSLRPFAPAPPKRCIFEYVYFSRPDSLLYGRNVYQVRKQQGRALARECPVDADIVVPVPDSGNAAALGYAEESGLPFEMGLVRSHYVGRTFIEPRQSIRHFGVKIKFNPVAELLRGKRIVLVEDSLVRGTTLRKVIPMLRQAGAREVHMRIAAPPTTNSCFYGIDTPTREELLASQPVDRGDPPLHHGRLARLPELGRTVFLRRRPARGLLRRLLYRQLSGRDSGQSRTASVASVRSRRQRAQPLTRRAPVAAPIWQEARLSVD